LRGRLRIENNPFEALKRRRKKKKKKSQLKDFD
jgi:hypothetical protein